MTQKEQRLLQPSWIFRVGRVWWDSPPWTGATRTVVSWLMSPIRIWADFDFAGAAGVVAILGCGAGCRAESGRKAGVDDGEDCADWGAACCAPTTDAWALPNRFAAGRSVEFEGRDMDWGAIRSGIWGLWELPTTQETPGRVASSSGARWA